MFTRYGLVGSEMCIRDRSRIVELRGLTRQETDPEAVQALKRRVAALLPLWQEARDLARLTAHYYDYDKEAHR